MAGLFFCLASAEGARLLFLTCCNTPKHKLLQRVFRRSCNYTTSTSKQRTGLCSGFSCDLPHSTAYDTRPTKADIMPPAPRWSVYQRPDCLQAYTKIPPPRRTLYRSEQPPIIIRYIRTPLLWIHARQCSIPQTMPARRGLDTSHAWH
jgi:hypothetical protein